MTNWPTAHCVRYLAREEILSVSTDVFIGCYRDVRFHMEVSAGEMKLMSMLPDQARNQLGTPGGAKSFLRVAQIF